MYKRQSDGKVINSAFLKLHYPAYWHYDILMGLKVMTEAGFIKDKRCEDALDLLESNSSRTEGSLWKHDTFGLEKAPAQPYLEQTGEPCPRNT